LILITITVALIFECTLSLRKITTQPKSCLAKAEYVTPTWDEKDDKECSMKRKVIEYGNQNVDNSVLDKCLKKFRYMDKKDIKGNNNHENSITPECMRKNRFGETYTYEKSGLTTKDDKYLNSAKFTGRVVEQGEELVYISGTNKKGWIAATNAPIGEVEDVQNDNALNEICGGAKGFIKKEEGYSKCFSGNFIENDKFVKDNTILAFYKTLKKNNIDYVVMLTNFVETVLPVKNDENCNCKVKADKYFPFINDQGTYDEYKIKNPDHTTDSGYSVTATEGSNILNQIIPTTGSTNLKNARKSIDVRNLSFKKGTDELHKVTHVHFKGWLDFGVPTGNEKTVLENLVKFIREKIDDGKNVIAHCTGGIGRTGTFIASILTSKLSKNKEIELVKFILELRKQRPDFVENAGQIGFIKDNMAKTSI